MTAAAGAPHNLGAQFQAKWDSNCPGCDQAVYEGDLMGYVDDVAQCDGCYNDADLVNRADLRAMIERQREEERAADPEGFDRRQAAVKKWVDSVKAKALEEPGKEWVTSPGATPGWVRNPDHEPPTGQDTPVTTETVEPGIAALMAAGLLQGQEPGGSGVCHATVEAAGIVTEVAIPVPPAPPVKARAPRKSRAKPKPEAPSTETVGGPGEDLPAAALTQYRSAATVARTAQLEANAADWDPAAIAAEVQASALQTGLQSAVNSGAMTCEQAEALGWVDPVRTMLQEAGALPPTAAVQMAQDDAAMAELDTLEAARPDAPSASTSLALTALAAASAPEVDAVLTALDELPAYVGGFNHDAAKKEILGVLQDAINYHPRSLQKKIGPSEIGTECDHCLAAKLAGWEQVDRDAWLPTVGTAVHSWIESAFGRIPAGPGGSRRFLTERRVSVGEIDGVEITGSTDLCDTVLGATWDWKIVGPTTLKSAKTGPSRRYVVQQQLYGRGWNRMGVKVTQVGIAYLPRNAMSLSAGVWWSTAYDEQVAVDALERASGFARNLRALATIGQDAVDAYVSGLPRWRLNRVDGKAVEGNAQEGAITCLDCARYKDYPADPSKALAQLDGLL